MSWRTKLASVLREEIGLLPAVLRIHWAQNLANLIPYEVGYRSRAAILRLGGIPIGKGTVIMGPMRIWGRHRLTIGSDTTINGPCGIALEASVTIGDRVLIGHDVIIATGHHEIGPHWCRGGALAPRPVVIEDGVWIGARVLILPGVTLGAGCVVGGGAVVTRDVPPNTVAVGVPARVMRELSRETAAHPAEATAKALDELVQS